MKDKVNAAVDTVVAFKLVWFRVACYFFVPAGLLFLTQTETYGQDTWDAMGSFLRTRLYIACLIAGATSICAYIDSSYQRARDRATVMKDDRAIEGGAEPRPRSEPAHEHV